MVSENKFPHHFRMRRKRGEEDPNIDVIASLPIWKINNWNWCRDFFGASTWGVQLLKRTLFWFVEICWLHRVAFPPSSEQQSEDYLSLHWIPFATLQAFGGIQVLDWPAAGVDRLQLHCRLLDLIALQLDWLQLHCRHLDPWRERSSSSAIGRLQCRTVVVVVLTCQLSIILGFCTASFWIHRGSGVLSGACSAALCRSVPRRPSNRQLLSKHTRGWKIGKKSSGIHRCQRYRGYKTRRENTPTFKKSIFKSYQMFENPPN